MSFSYFLYFSNFYLWIEVHLVYSVVLLNNNMATKNSRHKSNPHNLQSTNDRSTLDENIKIKGGKVAFLALAYRKGNKRRRKKKKKRGMQCKYKQKTKVCEMQLIVELNCLYSSIVSKLSSTNLGYIDDPFLHFFVSKRSRRSPLINRYITHNLCIFFNRFFSFLFLFMNAYCAFALFALKFMICGRRRKNQLNTLKKLSINCELLLFIYFWFV